MVHGCTNSFFGSEWKELAKSEAERQLLTDALKSFLQRTHPDKVDGMDAPICSRRPRRRWVMSAQERRLRELFWSYR
ncbi:hypothetical protein F6R98_19975 [Candidatus Methylospira mobilis]|uniref:Uncharacterized protein n=1 Tax=Candidatus Methylospira mobilis TaxID=1808979 RepID=A0A5Q0BN92_9GAMM|nr:hypothetical protein F6R98_19975 [Candidatus Methylospira mobilis]